MNTGAGYDVGKTDGCELSFFLFPFPSLFPILFQTVFRLLPCAGREQSTLTSHAGMNVGGGTQFSEFNGCEYFEMCTSLDGILTSTTGMNYQSQNGCE
jgi:hypothetical protein